jgi:hypothetical protein
MKRPITLAGACIVVAGCSGGGGMTSDQQMSLRAIAVQEIEALNARGVNPIELDGVSLALLRSSCTLGTAVVTVWNPMIASLSQGGADLCAVIMKAATPVPGAVDPDVPTDG